MLFSDLFPNHLPQKDKDRKKKETINENMIQC